MKGGSPASARDRQGRRGLEPHLVHADKVDADSKDKYGRTPLSWAATTGHETVVKVLLEAGKIDADSK